MKQKEPCGCTHDGARWLSECSHHKAENDALHKRWLRDRNGLVLASPTAPASPTAEPDWLLS